MRVYKPKTITSIIALPCDLCGAKEKIVSTYLQAASDRKNPKGFYSDLGIHLCEDCIDKMKKEIIREE